MHGLPTTRWSDRGRDRAERTIRAIRYTTEITGGGLNIRFRVKPNDRR